MTLSPAARDTPCIVLPPLLDRAYARELKAALLGAMVLGKGIEIDAGEVQRVTTPCLQILVAAAKSLAENRSTPLIFSKVSGTFFDSAATLALAQILGLEGV